MWFTHRTFADGEAFEAKVLRSQYSDINDEWYYTVECKSHRAADMAPIRPVRVPHGNSWARLGAHVP